MEPRANPEVPSPESFGHVSSSWNGNEVQVHLCCPPHVHTHGLGQSAKRRQPGLGWTGHQDGWARGAAALWLFNWGSWSSWDRVAKNADSQFRSREWVNQLDLYPSSSSMVVNILPLSLQLNSAPEHSEFHPFMSSMHLFRNMDISYTTTLLFSCQQDKQHLRGCF